MAGLQKQDIQPLLEQAEQAVRSYQNTQKFDALAVACPLQDLTAAFAGASTDDRVTIKETTIKHITDLQNAGLDNANLFILTRGLCNLLDKAVKNQKEESVADFSKTLAEYGLGRFLHMAYAKASSEGIDPEAATFSELAAARIQATGSMGIVFTKKHADTKAAGKVTLS